MWTQEKGVERMRNLLIIVLFSIAAAQLAMLCFGRRKKLKCLKRFLISCAALGLLFWLPPVFWDGLHISEFPFAKLAVAGAGNADSSEYLTFPERAGSDGQVIYFNQADSRWADKKYGPSDLIRDTGCGPTVLAMAVSSFTDKNMNPEEMCQWAYENGYCSVGSGSYHGLIAEGLEHFGLKNTVTNNGDEVKQALLEKRPVIALMGEGHFTGGGHFILLCDIDEEGKVSVADSNSAERTQQKWDFDLIRSEAKMSPVSGGAFWMIETGNV